MTWQSDRDSASEAQAQLKILELFAKKPKTRLTPAEILRRGGFDRDELHVRLRAGERIIKLERALEDQNRALREAQAALLKTADRPVE